VAHTSPRQRVDGDVEVRAVVKVIDGGHYDSDDVGILYFGGSASTTDRLAVEKLVRDYFAALNTEDGPKACSLTFSLFAEAIPEDYGQPPGSPSTRGKTCPVVMSKLLKQRHNQHIDMTKFHVTGVRVRQNQGLAQLSTGTRVESGLRVRRERGTWKIAGLTETGIP
jgi:hypothetical protein